MAERTGTTYAPPLPAADPKDPRGGAYESRRSGREPVIGLVAGLAEDMTLLVRQEAELVRAELAEKVEQAKSGVKALSAGAMILYPGVLLVLTALALLIDQWIEEPWLSFLIVGGVVAIAGAILLARGKQELSVGSWTPRRTAESLQKDADLVREQSRRT